MKVVLVRPAAGAPKWLSVVTGPGYPLGLAYVAAAIEDAGHQVSVCDAAVEGFDTVQLYGPGIARGLTNQDLVRSIAPDTRVVGISAMFTMDWLIAVDFCRRLRQALPEVTIILGGEHVSAAPGFSLKSSGADIAVLGEGEETVVEILSVLEGGATEDLRRVRGIALRAEGEVLVTAPRPPIRDIDAIAPPAWHLFPVAEYHRRRVNVGGLHGEPTPLPILASRGCPHRCTFCSAAKMWGRWRCRDPVAVVDEMELFKETLGATEFHFFDLMAVAARGPAERLAQELISRDLQISWSLSFGIRAEWIEQELLALMRQSGLKAMVVAADGSSDRSRALSKKQISELDIMRAIEDAAAQRLFVEMHTVVGLPHDGYAEIPAGIRMAWRAGKMGIDEFSPKVFTPYMGSELFDELLAPERAPRPPIGHLAASDDGARNLRAIVPALRCVP